jgi:hypothetical protein
MLTTLALVVETGPTLTLPPVRWMKDYSTHYGEEVLLTSGTDTGS